MHRIQLLVLAASVSPLVGCTLPSATRHAQERRIDSRVLSWGDQGDGTYRNPILKSDYSDPDILRVGNDFYLIASDFHFSTMQVLHSRDLVNWGLAGKVFDSLTMAPKYDQMKGYGEGTWAPSIRYHDGQFYIYVCTPGDGLYMWHAKDAAGPWSPTVTVKAVERWEDPCPFWDDDGQAYLVHSMKGSGPIIINRMSSDGTQLLDEGKEVYRGRNSEGPKMFKRNGYYYISLPEGGFSVGGQTILRSRSVYGPYERKSVFDGQGEHQGGLVELEDGKGWFICFKRLYGSGSPLGRVAFLEPVQWNSDDWPVIGDQGKPVGVHRKPELGVAGPIERPAASDEFSGGGLGLQWQWNHNPIGDKWSLTERPGFLRLHATPAESFELARNTLTQKLWDEAGVVDVRMEVSGFADGQRAGLALMYGKTFGCIGVRQSNGARVLDLNGVAGAPWPEKEIWLRATYEKDAGYFWYSHDGKRFIDSGVRFKLGYGNWKGTRPALYCFGSESGYADVDYFRYTYDNTLARAMAAVGDSQ